jgi:hypothetical protein
LDIKPENIGILYLISHSLFRDNSQSSYKIICHQISQDYNIAGCSIWKKEDCGQQRLAYSEKGFSADVLELSNADFEINKIIISGRDSLVFSELALKISKYKGLKVLGMPVVYNEILVGSICFYYIDVNGTEMKEELRLISNELSYGIYHIGRGIAAPRQESLMKELEKARAIQQSLLPEKPPKVQGVRLGARTLPTYEISGDYFDFITTEKNKLGIVIADVMGKGVPASILMAVARTVTRSVARRDLIPDQVLSEININLYPDLSKQGMFVTMFYALYDPTTRLLSFSSAGHNPPIILSGSTGKIDLLRSKGIFIGGSPDAIYRTSELILNSGDTVLLYTDGLTEAKNDEGVQFGIKKVAEVIKEYSYCDINTVIDCLCMRVKGYVKAREQKDDITVVMLKID